MKKLLFLSILILSLSCSNSDDGEGSVRIRLENFVGIWDYKEKIMPDGNIIPYNHRCQSRKDHWHLKDNQMFEHKLFIENCSPDIPWSSLWFISETDRVLQINGFGTYKIQKLTKNEMILDNYMSNGDLFYTWVMVRRNP